MTTKTKTTKKFVIEVIGEQVKVNKYGDIIMKTITLTDKQFEQLKEYVVDSCENIMDRSLEWADSDLSNELIDNNEILFDFRTILEEAV